MNAVSDEALVVRGSKVVEKRHADLSDDDVYRYTLLRSWDTDHPPMVFVMLNPSTADALEDDPTIRRCRGFAEREGAGGIMVVNLYAFRTPKPAILWEARGRHVDIVGKDNDEWILAVFQAAHELGSPVVAAWGAGSEPDRVEEVVGIAAAASVSLQALALTKHGKPGHPLYLRADAELRTYPYPGRRS